MSKLQKVACHLLNLINSTESASLHPRQIMKRSQKSRIISDKQNRLRFSHAVGMPESSP